MDLIWGYTGILSLGHGLFFALGGYAMGMYLMRQIGLRRQLQKRPARLHGVSGLEGAALALGAVSDSFVATLFLVVAVPGLVAFVFGYFAFRSRIKGVYFSIITQAMTFAAMLLFFRNETGFGGNNGFTDFKRILDIPIATPEHAHDAVCADGAARCCGFFLMARWLVNSKFGRVLQAVRDAETRVMFSGYNPLGYKLTIWTISAMMCGVAGALYVPQVGIINPSEMSAGQLHRDRHLGGGGRARHADRADRRGLHRQRRQELAHRGLPRVLAVLSGRPVHRRDAVSARWRGRPGARKKAVADAEAPLHASTAQEEGAP